MFYDKFILYICSNLFCYYWRTRIEKLNSILNSMYCLKKKWYILIIVLTFIFYFKDDVYKPSNILNTLSDDLCKVWNEVDSPLPDEQIDELNIPISIRILRKYLTPDGKENTTSKKFNSQIVQIEDRLNLNFRARKQFRKLLFPSDEDLNNIY